ncbi:hypothetical protein BV25DRAFT_1810152 [Artomyces pyxidatus]|uniref:Uncharacterized protein n=1 Tax=Artomyces pyxidatus TaxID=48021 RepID=A0ACB8SSF8_9AGAM|nr:hypothetical protein BV25DRAFT_1810152 [Artomyces pyxidatus]
MVASTNNELYTPFPRGITLEEGFQSSEEGSDLHSPVFEQSFSHFASESRYPIATDSPPHAAGLITSTFASPYYMSGSTHSTTDPHASTSRDLPSLALTLSQPAPYPQSFTSSTHVIDPTNRVYPSLTHTGQTPFARPIDMMVPDQAVSLPQIPMPQPALGDPYSPTAGTAAQDPPVASSSTARPVASNTTSRARTSRNISNQVIACRQCRSRKIRCDSTRPECNNCLRRSNECIYDVVPKRRGPDKRPGTRQRSCKKRPTDGSEPQPRKKRKTDPVDDSASPTTSFKDDASSPPVPLHAPLQVKADPDFSALHALSQSSSALTETTSSYRVVDAGLLRKVRCLVHRESFSDSLSPSIPAVPSTEYTRKVWWDNLLNTYSATREQALHDITTDLNELFDSTTSNYWLTFFRMPSPLPDLRDKDVRSHLQPSLVLAGLALATLLKSSELERGAAGRDRALRLRDAAQSSLEASWNSQWIDLNLAKAAMVLALFETSAHPLYSPARADSALVFLDKIVQALQLTSIDIHDPDRLDHSTGVPLVVRTSAYLPNKECACIVEMTPVQWDKSMSFTPGWDPVWSPAEVQNEETRRLCWSALILVANHTVTAAASQRKPLDLYLIDSSNYNILFPGEYLERSRNPHSPQSGKDTVWALYCRSMLLWNSCMRFQDEGISRDVRAQMAVSTFLEIRSVEDALDTHTCNIDTALIYMCREFISKCVMLLDLDETGQPAWNYKQAKEWLNYQDHVARRIKPSLPLLTGSTEHPFLRRPFQISWFTNQLIVCLTIWNTHNELTNALDLAKMFLLPIEVLNALWPCPAFRRQCSHLREQLHDACLRAQVAPPLLPEYMLPPPLLRLQSL